ncbi:MAG: ATP-binding cassette domain-containing protein [Gammaproteobacteria bacterium]|nr:ATP-binding cassette domain-containing protein [Gammaproteobacteria bacterium]
MQSSALIRVENLSRFYQTHRAISHLSFSLNAGEVLGFLGPNGAGKSTTMQIISGNLAPSEGEVSISGFDILESPCEAKQQIGYLPEHPPVYRDSTVNEYLQYCARLRRIKSNAIADAVDRVRQSCGLTEVGKRLIGNLSKGFQQRIGIAQAIIHDPPVVILDEPTVGLDPIQIREIRNLIKNLGKQHSVILSTHILSEVQTTCDRVQIIRQGELIYNASIEMLNQGRKSSISIALKRAPAADVLQRIKHVSHVEQKDDQRFHLFFDTASPAEIIVQQSVENDWGLIELTPDQQSLEDLFIELTQHQNTDHEKVLES